MKSLFKFQVYRKDTTFRKWLKWHLCVAKDKYYRRKLTGTGGTLPNGVSWWLDLPNPEQDKEARMLHLSFDDPIALGCVCRASMTNTLSIFERYEFGKGVFKECLERNGYELAEPEDPAAFLVKVKTRKDG